MDGARKRTKNCKYYEDNESESDNDPQHKQKMMSATHKKKPLLAESPTSGPCDVPSEYSTPINLTQSMLPDHNPNECPTTEDISCPTPGDCYHCSYIYQQSLQ